jgi:UDP-N-acetyl-D-glucosamine dehydrogenase
MFVAPALLPPCLFLPDVLLGSLAGELKQKIESRTTLVSVIGLGFVGLPLAVDKTKVGFKVLGVGQTI